MSGIIRQNRLEVSPNRSTQGKRPDRRPRLTRNTLGDALALLMQEKHFDEITVQDVLDRAGVGRTTFYTHFTDKEDLFLTDVEQFLEMMGSFLNRQHAPAQRLAPVREFLEHLAGESKLYKAIVASGKMQEVHELGIGIFARSIEQRLSSMGAQGTQVELRATAQALAGAMFSMLDWWVQSPQDLSPTKMDAIFHSMANVSQPNDEQRLLLFRGT